eukprot:GHVP01017534.1.p1 GENE.GHVP01017534.1~~GHVP01017534.1.p1  ORF type:complete len:101 (+),score=4.57 GHVP01017534.1:806-1108(+)
MKLLDRTTLPRQIPTPWSQNRFPQSIVTPACMSIMVSERGFMLSRSSQAAFLLNRVSATFSSLVGKKDVATTTGNTKCNFRMQILLRKRVCFNRVPKSQS